MIHVLIAEDQEIVRRGLKLLLATQSDIEVAGEAGDGQEVVELMVRLNEEGQRPEIVLMDIKMPVVDGVTATKSIMEQFPDTKIIVLTTFEDSQFVSKALSYGAKGYLLKDTPLEELADTIRFIHKGYTQFGPGILEKVVMDTAQAAPPELPPGLTELSAKEKEVLSLVAQGSNNKEIAAALFISEGTVRNHITHILGRLNVRDRTQAAIVAHSFLSHLTG